MSKSIAETTEADFLAFARKICYMSYPSEEAHTAAVLEFRKISEHPSGPDLIYYPEDGHNSPEQIVEKVKAWRAANGNRDSSSPDVPDI